MKQKYIKAATFITIGMILGFPIFSMAYFTMVRTPTPKFCASCHEIQFAVKTWKTSTHTNNLQGVVADCMDCHLPSPMIHSIFFCQNGSWYKRRYRSFFNRSI